MKPFVAKKGVAFILATVLIVGDSYIGLMR
jgi:hypothetical protein